MTPSPGHLSLLPRSRCACLPHSPSPPPWQGAQHCGGGKGAQALWVEVSHPLPDAWPELERKSLLLPWGFHFLRVSWVCGALLAQSQLSCLAQTISCGLSRFQWCWNLSLFPSWSKHSLSLLEQHDGEKLQSPSGGGRRWGWWWTEAIPSTGTQSQDRLLDPSFQSKFSSAVWGFRLLLKRHVGPEGGHQRQTLSASHTPAEDHAWGLFFIFLNYESMIAHFQETWKYRTRFYMFQLFFK